MDCDEGMTKDNSPLIYKLKAEEMKPTELNNV